MLSIELYWRWKADSVTFGPGLHDYGQNDYLDYFDQY